MIVPYSTALPVLLFLYSLVHRFGDADGAKKALDELVTLEPENMKLCFMHMVGIL